MSAEEDLVLQELEVEVQAEIRLVQSGDASDAASESQDTWLFDPSDVERYRIGLFGLLGAVRAMEADPEPS